MGGDGGEGGGARELYLISRDDQRGGSRAAGGGARVGVIMLELLPAVGYDFGQWGTSLVSFFVVCFFPLPTLE